MKTIKLSKISLCVILFLGVNTLTLTAQDKKIIPLENNNTNKAQRSIEKSTKDYSKKNSNFENYQQWNNNYTNDKFQKGSISTH